MTGRESAHPIAAVSPAAPSTQHIVEPTAEQVPLAAAQGGRNATLTTEAVEVAPRRESTPDDGAAQDDSLTDEQYLAKRLKRTIGAVEPEDEDERAKRSFSQDERVVEAGTPSGNQASEQVRAFS